MPKERTKELSSWDSDSKTTTTRETTVNVDPRVVAVTVAVAETLAVEDVVVVKEKLFSMPLTRMTSQLSEAESPAGAAPKVNFKSLDCSHAFRCDE